MTMWNYCTECLVPRDRKRTHRCGFISSDMPSGQRSTWGGLGLYYQNLVLYHECTVILRQLISLIILH